MRRRTVAAAAVDRYVDAALRPIAIDDAARRAIAQFEGIADGPDA